MTKRIVSLLWRATAVVIVIAVIAALAIRSIRTSAQVEDHDFGSKMVKYVKEGRFDEAVQVGLQSLQNQPDDEIVYQQIADVYLIRAGKDAGQRQQWLSKAVFYVEKSLSLNSKDRDVAGVHVLQDARSFETIADLSMDSRCTYYDRAKKLLEGKTFPLAPLREENTRRLNEVQAKRTKAGCK
jgi:hypothetical protein